MLTLLDLPLSDSSDWLVGTYPAAAESAGSTGCTWRLGGILRYRTVAIWHCPNEPPMTHCCDLLNWCCQCKPLDSDIHHLQIKAIYKQAFWEYWNYFIILVKSNVSHWHYCGIIRIHGFKSLLFTNISTNMEKTHKFSNIGPPELKWFEIHSMFYLMVLLGRGWRCDP